MSNTTTFATFLICFAVLLGHSQENKLIFNGRLILGTCTEPTLSVAVRDIDGDGHTHIIVDNGRHWPGKNRILINNGNRIFTVERHLGDQITTGDGN